MRKRLLLSYLTITVLVLIGLEVPLGFSFARSERRRLEQSVHQDAVTIAIRAEENLESGPDAAGQTELRSLLSRYQHESGDRVIITDGVGRRVATSEPPDETEHERTNLLQPREITRALSGHETSGTRSSRSLGSLWFVAVPVTSGNQVTGVVRVTHPLSSVNARVRNNWLLLAGIGGGVLAVVFVMSLLVARSVTRPLAELGRAASRLGHGNLEARAPVPQGPEEVRLLAQEFNTTAARLESLVGAQQAFVADASHQLRTPLAALRLRLENLESEVDAPAAEDVEGARAEVERLTRLVDGLLALARAERAPTEPTNVEVGAVVAGRRDAWLAFAGEHDVGLTAETPVDLWASATPERLEQVLDNLLNNALAQAPAGSTVSLGAARRRDRVQVWVRDDGPGMTAEDQARAFDRFWRGSTEPGDNGGFGLGLAIVRQLVTADGGSVELRSRTSGGLEVTVELRAGTRPASVTTDDPAATGAS